jgi:hypothetical protein
MEEELEIFKKIRKEEAQNARTNRFKIFVFLSLAPFIAWYGNQSSNNPWKMRNSFFFDGNEIVLFQENNKNKTEEFRISVNDGLEQNIDIHGWEIRERIWGISIICGDTNIIFADKNFEKNLSPISCDILVSTAETNENLAQERLFFRPKTTIWFTESPEILPAKNIFIPKPNERFRVKKNRGNFIILTKG